MKFFFACKILASQSAHLWLSKRLHLHRHSNCGLEKETAKAGSLGEDECEGECGENMDRDC